MHEIRAYFRSISVLSSKLVALLAADHWRDNADEFEQLIETFDLIEDDMAELRKLIRAYAASIVLPIPHPPAGTGKTATLRPGVLDPVKPLFESSLKLSDLLPFKTD